VSNRLRSLRDRGFYCAEGFLRFLLFKRCSILRVHPPAEGSEESAGCDAKDEAPHLSAQTGSKAARRNSREPD
jgi:hypothetical protein